VLSRLAARAAGALALALAAHVARPQAPEEEVVRFWPSVTCAGCHVRHVEQHLESRHERSFKNPLFQAQYFEHVLPRAARDPAIEDDARACTACHSPVSYANTRGLATSAGVTDPSLAGVTCDLCHTITGYDGPAPQNGNFVAAPGPEKRGPIRREASHHGRYSALHTRSEFCAICHEAVNSHGVRVKGTYTEWRRSDFAKRGFQCQDCHMSRDGVYVDGGRYESGAVSADGLSGAPRRDRVSTHRFPGIHPGAPVEGVVSLRIELGQHPLEAGRAAEVTVSLDNTRTGHRLPTGSADLRLLWLEVTAQLGDRLVPLPASARVRGSWSVADEDGDDPLVAGDVAPGSRLYRAVFLDRRNRQTLASFEATSIVFDNRLLPGEVRSETYALQVPPDAAGTVRLEARLRYRAYPPGLARDLDVAASPVVEVARAVLEAPVAPARPAEPGALPEGLSSPEKLTPMEKLQRLRNRSHR
jgi:hypothetical protein